MIRSIKVVAASLGVALAAAGCGSFLTGEKLSSDPNQPSSATRDQLFVGVQANLVSSDATPTLDSQAAVYDSVQALLSQAIVELGGPGGGPGPQDLVYGGNKANWIAAANTLKARYYLHRIEAAANKAAVYGNAITAATSGIASPAAYLKTFHTSATSERNIWYQLKLTTFGQDVEAGKFLVDLMKARSDPRLPQYDGKNKGGGYGGQDMNVPQSSDAISAIKGGGRNAPDFQQPLVTYQENELILAEAYSQTGNDPVALTHLNNARAVAPLPALVAITGAALFDSIMT